MKLPLLDYTSEMFKDVDFNNVLLIAVQHILETNFTMFEYLFGLGLKPENTFLLGKCYSTNKEVLEKFRKKGVYVHAGSLRFDSHLSFDDQFEAEVKNFLEYIQTKVNLSDYKKVLFVDDGGRLACAGNFLVEKDFHGVAIEQTSSGYNKLRCQNLKIPVINVARSEAKLNFESPFIAGVIIEKLEFKFKKNNVNYPVGSPRRRTPQGVDINLVRRVLIV
ncbi:MAG: hypothetical protein V1716_00145 [Candidatus Uhrbacteria bacterium]